MPCESCIILKKKIAALSRQLELGEIDMDAARQENVDTLKDLAMARRDLKQLRRAIANVLV